MCDNKNLWGLSRGRALWQAMFGDCSVQNKESPICCQTRRTTRIISCPASKCSKFPRNYAGKRIFVFLWPKCHSSLLRLLKCQWKAKHTKLKCTTRYYAFFSYILYVQHTSFSVYMYVYIYIGVWTARGGVQNMPNANCENGNGVQIYAL
jgi:hypothetical protein